MDRPGSQLRLLLAAACLTLGAGCIEGKVETYARYDRAADSFACLQVYTDIVARSDGDLDHVARLWRQRENLIVDAIPRFRLFSSATIFERRGKHDYREVPIAQNPLKDRDVATTSVDLEAIRVIPGEFFLSGNGGLCGYQQALIPGTAVDAAMREMVPAIAEGLAKLAEFENGRAAEAGQKKATWDEVRELIRASLEGKTVKPDEDKVNQVKLLPLEAESLRLMSKAGEDRSVTFRREADALLLAVPLTARDCDEVVATVDMARKVIAERVKARKTVDRNAAAILDAVETRHVEGAGLGVTVHVGKLPEFRAGEQSFAIGANDDRKSLYRSTVESIRKRGVKVDEADLSRTILKRFAGPVPGP